MAIVERLERLLDVRTAKLDDLLALPYPLKSQALEEFLDDPHGDGDILLKANDGKNMQVWAAGRGELKVTPRGRRVKRNVAISILEDYGRTGTYYNKDQATGLSTNEWRFMNEKQREPYKGLDMNFRTQYLTHIPDSVDAEDEETFEQQDEPALRSIGTQELTV